jgi:hypothetical protein
MKYPAVESTQIEFKEKLIENNQLLRAVIKTELFAKVEERERVIS